MDNLSLSIGTQVEHPQYGRGVILDNTMEIAYLVAFKNIGQKGVAKDSGLLKVVEVAPSGQFSLGDVKQIMTQVLEEYSGAVKKVKMAPKWEGGTVTIQAADSSLKPKEIPIDKFFHKIIMVRDRLRVLEQNVNKNKSLSKEEKLHLQQYITKCYGSLTTFNVLFRFKEDGFKGESTSR